MTTDITDIIDILKADYARFPKEQTLTIYSQDVYFEDPLNQFRGLDRYSRMISTLERFFSEIAMELISIEQTDQIIHTRWILRMKSPWPWRSPITIPGTSELTLNQDNLITHHRDRWDCSRWHMVKQFVGFISADN
jgi:hypothetical protein